MKARAFTGIEVLIVLAVIGAATFAIKPSLFPGASRRAAQSTQATAAVEAATTAQGATVAAGLTQIGTANTAAPSSPSRDFVSREVPYLLSMLPAPGAQALLEAEKRRVAVMEGRAEEARRLYESAAARAEQLQRERDAALAARHAADLALEQAAAAEHARTMQAAGAAVLALLFLAGWVWLKFHSVGIGHLGQLAADLKTPGVNPLAALDAIVDHRLHDKVKRAAKQFAP
jgi:hypothetical protein